MKNYPLIKFVLLFICGIIFQKVFQFNINASLLILACLLIIPILLFTLKSSTVKSAALNLSLAFAIFAAGALYLGIHQLGKINYPFEKQKHNKSVVYGKIYEIELQREGQIIFSIETDSVLIENNIRKISVNILCRIYDDNLQLIDDTYDQLAVGNYIAVKGTIQKGRGKRNPGEFNYYNYLKSEGISALCNIYKSSDMIVLTNDIDVLKNTVFSIRKSIDKQIEKLHTKEAAGLVRGLLLADRSKIDYDLRQSFVNAGVVHVLAVSGLHVGFIILIFLFLFGRLNIYLRYIFTILGLVLFVVITGSPPSVFRASVMAITLIVAFLTNRSYNSINSLALAAFILLLLNPAELFNPGFQLSFSAVLSIVLIYPLFSEKIYAMKLKSKIANYILLFIAVSLAAQIGTLPFTLIYFHKLSIAAIFANLLVIPAIGIIILVSIFALTVSIVWTWLGLIYASATNGLVELLFVFVDEIGSLEMSHIYITQFSVQDTIIFYISIFTLFYFWRKFLNISAKLVFSILLVLITFLYLSLDNHKILADGKLSIMAIDVGQGDGLLLKFPDGQTALIDAGDRTEYFDNGARVISPLLKYLGIDKINYGFVSHLDSDHYGGFVSLLKNNLVEKIYKPAFDPNNENDAFLEALLDSLSVPTKYYQKDIIEIGCCRIYVLNTASSPLFNSFDTNDKSGILKVIYGKTSFLFMGDAGFKSEDVLLDIYADFVDSDVLKAGHHGSKNSTSDKLLDFVSPDIAVISAGIQNRFRHPSKIIIDKLASSNIRIDRTDYSGALLYQSDGKDITEINWYNYDVNLLSNY